jgi:hypothetical protein
MARLLVKACSASLQASSPSPQVEEAAGQVDSRNWNWKKTVIYTFFPENENNSLSSHTYRLLGLGVYVLACICYTFPLTSK